ncbi:hypothetical protein DdX_19481 [Ditylenchus destructor]|uniref:Uncharacterized protein n=1 Tax=Ditylenchus destructor TaxID=166010 RepID=A0AAD4QSB0_9BILA|nr:hypothetical protein DdX_19481 [Ditylenchus destructor]
MSNSKPVPPFTFNLLRYSICNILPSAFCSRRRISYSKPVVPFNFDVLYYLNRDELERFSIVCRSLKNYIDRYFSSKPYRIFEIIQLRVWAGYYALLNPLSRNHVYFCFNRDHVQQFLAGQKCKDDGCSEREYISFDEKLPFLGPTVRMNWTFISLRCTYRPEDIEQMESIAHLWRDGNIMLWETNITKELQPILSSPTTLKCQKLCMIQDPYFLLNPHTIKDYKGLYAVKVIEIYSDDYIDPKSWLEFLEEPGVKPVVVWRCVRQEHITNKLYHLCKGFSSAVSPNPFKIVFAELDKEELSEFRETNNTSGEILELKKGLPVEYQDEMSSDEDTKHYTLERSCI